MSAVFDQIQDNTKWPFTNSVTIRSDDVNFIFDFKLSVISK